MTIFNFEDSIDILEAETILGEEMQMQSKRQKAIIRHFACLDRH